QAPPAPGSSFMNQDQLEREIEERLRCLHPAAPSREFFQALGRQIESLPTPVHSRAPARLAMAATSLAACLVIGVLWPTFPRRVAHTEGTPKTANFDATELCRLPSVLAYRTRATQSIQDLDRLLDEHARSLFPPAEDSSVRDRAGRDRLDIP